MEEKVQGAIGKEPEWVSKCRVKGSDNSGAEEGSNLEIDGYSINRKKGISQRHLISACNMLGTFYLCACLHVY